MADLIQTSTAAMAALLMLGGFTALFAAAVMLTQSAIKTALAWSTIAQMGFMLLQCGLGLWTLALLHIVAHSLYKAHAFLASGGAVKAVAEIRRPGPVAVPGLGAVLRAFSLALVLYALVATLFGFVFGAKSAQALSLGAILIFGVAYLVAQGMADTAPRELTRRTVMASFAATLAYFGFHLVADLVWGAHLPAAPAPGPLEWGADRADAVLLRSDRRGPGAVSALGPPSRSGGTARASGERPLSQRRPRSHDRRFHNPEIPLISSIAGR